MFRIVLSRVSAGTRFKRCWVPSLDRIEELSRQLRLHGSAEDAIEARRVTDLIGHVRIGGTNKSTSPARLEAADAALLTQLHPNPSDGLQFLDIGCSDGTTSLDTIERIERTLGVAVTPYLMDRYIWVRRASRWFVVEYTGAEDQLIMARCGPFALAPPPGSFLLAPLTNRVVSAYLGLTGFRQKMQETARFPLLSPRVLVRSDLRICEGSILTPNNEFVGRMHVVRVSNLLHFDYFAEAEIRAAVSNLASYLRDGGLLLISRNHQERHGEFERGTVWRRVGNTLVAVADFGGGSELKGLINSMSPLDSRAQCGTETGATSRAPGAGSAADAGQTPIARA